jgi:hypothetical protein
MVLLGVAIVVSMSALTAGAIAVFSVNARVAATARLLSAVLLLAALVLFAIVALSQDTVDVTSRRRQDVARDAGDGNPHGAWTSAARTDGYGVVSDTSRC